MVFNRGTFEDHPVSRVPDSFSDVHLGSSFTSINGPRLSRESKRPTFHAPKHNRRLSFVHHQPHYWGIGGGLRHRGSKLTTKKLTRARCWLPFLIFAVLFYSFDFSRRLQKATFCHWIRRAKKCPFEALDLLPELRSSPIFQFVSSTAQAMTIPFALPSAGANQQGGEEQHGQAGGDFVSQKKRPFKEAPTFRPFRPYLGVRPS